MEKVRFALVVLGILFGLLVVPTLVFLVKGNEVAAAVTGTLTVGIVVATTHTLAFGAGALYTRSAMAMGAGIALKAQETNDRWDERKTASFAAVMREGARIARQERGGELPALPLPSQDMAIWSPVVDVFQEAAGESDWYEQS